MITAYVLIQTEVGKAGQVASAAVEIDGVEQALPLAGRMTSSSARRPVTSMRWADWSCHGSRPSMVSRAP
jgi:hypothetical protein